MKKLLKSDICGSHEQYTGPTDVIKGQKSKKSVDTVLSPTAADKKKKKKKKKIGENATHKTQRTFQCYPNTYIVKVFFFGEKQTCTHIMERERGSIL